MAKDYEYVYQIERAIDSGIKKFMKKHVKGRAELAVLENIESEVYSYPTPMVYRRRHELDSKKNIVSNYDEASNELTVETIATGTFKHSGARLDILVENAIGVDWGGNAIYKRPFYDKADEDMQKYLDQIDSYLEQILNI